MFFFLTPRVPIVAIIRLVNIYRLLYLGEKFRKHNIAYIWTAVEVNLAVICCSMPALRPLFSRWFPKLFGSSHSGPSSDQPYGTSGRGGLSSSGTPGKSLNRDRRPGYMLKDLHSPRKQTRSGIGGESPSGSEEEILTYNGILRTTNVNIVHEDAKRSEGDSDVSKYIP